MCGGNGGGVCVGKSFSGEARGGGSAKFVKKYLSEPHMQRHTDRQPLPA